MTQKEKEQVEILAKAMLRLGVLPRNLRNNNPGNIIAQSGKWIGMQGSDGRFCVFRTMAFGFRAFFVLMHRYIDFGRCTLRAIITRYAPSSENDTEAYIKRVSDITGFPPDIPLGRPLLMGALPAWRKIAIAFCSVEAGIKPELLEEFFASTAFKKDPVTEGWWLARNSVEK